MNDNNNNDKTGDDDDNVVDNLMKRCNGFDDDVDDYIVTIKKMINQMNK